MGGPVILVVSDDRRSPDQTGRGFVLPAIWLEVTHVATKTVTLTREMVAERREARMGQHRCKACGAALMSAENVRKYTKRELKGGRTEQITLPDGRKGTFTLAGHTCGTNSKAVRRGRRYDRRDARYTKLGLLG